MFRLFSVVVGAMLAVTTFGCGPSGSQKPMDIKVPAQNDALAQPISLLERYAAGQPMTSEVTSFPAMVEALRKTDSAKADILQAGLDELQKAPPGARPAKAKEILGKLKPAAN